MAALQLRGWAFQECSVVKAEPEEGGDGEGCNFSRKVVEEEGGKDTASETRDGEKKEEKRSGGQLSLLLSGPRKLYDV